MLKFNNYVYYFTPQSHIPTELIKLFNNNNIEREEKEIII